EGAERIEERVAVLKPAEISSLIVVDAIVGANNVLAVVERIERKQREVVGDRLIDESSAGLTRQQTINISDCRAIGRNQRRNIVARYRSLGSGKEKLGLPGEISI